MPTKISLSRYEIDEFHRIGRTSHQSLTAEEKKFYDDIVEKVSPIECITYEEFQKRTIASQFDRAAAEQCIKNIRYVTIHKSEKGMGALTFQNFDRIPEVSFDVILYDKCPTGGLDRQLVHEFMHIHWKVHGSGLVKVNYADNSGEKIEDMLVEKEKEVLGKEPGLSDYIFDVLKQHGKLRDLRNTS